MAKVTFAPESKIIIVNSGITEIDVRVDLYSEWKEWILIGDNSKWAAAFNSVGGDPIGGGQYSPRYFFLTNGWKVKIENNTTGVTFEMNLYTSDGSTPFIINNASVTNRVSDVPVVTSEMEIRLEYGDKVYYDELTSNVGTSYPVGTIFKPVNNITDAILICQLYNISKIYSLSDISFTGKTIENYSFYADKDNITSILYSNSLNNTEWHGFIIDGNFNELTNKFIDCTVDRALNVSGQFKNCQINGNVKISNNLLLSNCYSGDESINPVFDMNSGTTLYMRAYSGGINLINCNTSGCSVTIELIAGHVILDTSCSNGNINIRGVGYLTNNSTGSIVTTSGLVTEFPLTSEDIDKLTSLTGLTELLVLTGMTEQLNTIESGVTSTNDNILIVNENVLQLTGITNEINNISAQLTGITIGLIDVSNQLTGLTENIDIINDDVKRILGLTQENFRIMDQVYDTNGSLQSATIKIYNNSADCDNNINPLAQYSMTALYDGNGRLTNYKVIKV